MTPNKTRSRPVPPTEEEASALAAHPSIPLMVEEMAVRLAHSPHHHPNGHGNGLGLLHGPFRLSSVLSSYLPALSSLPWMRERETHQRPTRSIAHRPKAGNGNGAMDPAFGDGGEGRHLHSGHRRPRSPLAEAERRGRLVCLELLAALPQRWVPCRARCEHHRTRPACA